jgi:hypothetical protein
MRPTGNGVRRIRAAAEIARLEPISGRTLAVNSLAGLLIWSYFRQCLNQIWEQEAEPLPGQKPPPTRNEKPPMLVEADSRDDRGADK